MYHCGRHCGFQAGHQVLPMKILEGCQEMRLLGDDALDRSGVVANCRMNRERTLAGSNGYSKELGFNPFDLLMEKACTKARWLWPTWTSTTSGWLTVARQTASLVENCGKPDWTTTAGRDCCVVPAAPRSSFRFGILAQTTRQAPTTPSNRPWTRTTSGLRLPPSPDRCGFGWAHSATAGYRGFLASRRGCG